MKIRRFATAAVLLAALSAPAGAQQTMTIATNPQGSIFYTVGTSVAKLMNDKLGLHVLVRPTAGSTSNVPLLDRGEIEFAILNIVDVNGAYEATDHFEGQPAAKNLRLMTPIFQVLFGLGVPDDSAFQQIKDIKGARMPTEYAAQKAVVPSIKAFLANGGLTFDDMKPFPVANYIKGIEALGDGKVDVAAVAPDTAATAELHAKLRSRGGLRMLPVDTSPEAWGRLQKLFPSMKWTMLKPTPTMPSIRSEIPVTTSGVFMATNAQMPPDLIYSVVKTIRDNRAELVAMHPIFNSFNPDQMADVATTPYHDGAQKLLKELNQWPPK
jgi:TRAP transporter TAXI family solute receptor